MHAEEGAERGVDPGQLHGDEAKQLLATTGAIITLKAKTAQLQFLE